MMCPLQNMAPSKTFQKWLQTQGLREKTAKVMITELGIESREVLQACVESDTVRAELFSLIKQKCPFAVYAELRSFVGSSWEMSDVRPEGSNLVNILYSMLNAVSQELSSCAEKLSFMETTRVSNTSDIGQTENDDRVFGIRISDICSLERKEEFGNQHLDAENQVDPSVFQCGSVLTSSESFGAVTDEQKACGSLTNEFLNIRSPMEDGANAVKMELLQENVALSLKEEPWNTQKARDIAFSIDEQSTSNIGRLNSECDPALKIKASMRNSAVAHPHGASQDTFKCRYCHYDTNLKRKLTLHMKIHRKDKLYVCSLCCKSYTQSSSLVVHMRSHTGERPYVCSICGKCFAHSSSFYLHKNVHNEDRPYKCTLCEKAFKYSHHVKTHMNVHKKDSNKLKFLATYGLALEGKPE
uniref:uncharacterized protein isoform X2 n=2 Tax=Myxine glutinosa TaxID=7769 RepID=UPI00358F475F